ncbi:hypothetical protein B0H11DRAFT_2251844 [Mycena galericulata]|nr:hypothetical protein B0H11DRAFT_2251844 [Mycena galericulata]
MSQQPNMSQPNFHPVPTPPNFTPVSITPTRPTAPLAPFYQTESIHQAHPSRPTCVAPYIPEAGVDRVAHSENAGCKFYVVGPGRVCGIYTDDKRATAQICGFSNDHMQGFLTWEEAKEAWAVVCHPMCYEKRIKHGLWPIGLMHYGWATLLGQYPLAGGTAATPGRPRIINICCCHTALSRKASRNTHHF